MVQNRFVSLIVPALFSTLVFAAGCGGAVEPSPSAGEGPRQPGGKACPTLVMVDCAPGFHLADIDGDGCALECIANEPKACPSIARVDCAPGFRPGDADGDGCALECVPE